MRVAIAPLAGLLLGLGCEGSSPPTDAAMDEGEAPDAVRADALATDVATSDAATAPDATPSVRAGVYERSLGAQRVRVTVFDDGAVRVQYFRERPSVDRGWTALARTAPTDALAVRALADEDALAAGPIELRVHRATGAVDVYRDGALVVDDRTDVARSERSLVRAVFDDEHFVGLGEKTGRLDLRGRAFTHWNSDVWAVAGGSFPPDTDPLYLSVPFFVSLRGGRALGTYVDNTFRARFDLGRASPEQLSVALDGGDLSYWLFAGPTLSAVVSQYTAVTGRPPRPPRWALGYHQSRWSYAPESALRAVARDLRAHEIPCDAVWLDIDHMDGYRSFTWDRAAFPDPQRVLSELAAQGLHTVAIIDPGLKRDDAWDLYREALAGAHLSLSPDGTVFHGRVWPGAAAFPDFTRAATRQWWGGLLGRPSRAGLSGAWIDMNEPTAFDAPGVPEDLRADGEGQPTSHREAHNVYALLMARATYEGLLRAQPDRRPFVLSRSGFAGTQRYAAVWTGDTLSTWDHLRLVPTMLSGMGVSGLSFVGSDAGGYSGSPEPELFARWMQLAALTPFFRSHVQTGTPPQEPWAFGPAVEAAARDAVRLRYSLLTYLEALFAEASATGAPVLRPVVYEFSDDPQALGADDQFLLGPHLLVAPVVLARNETRVVHLPPGLWTPLDQTRTIQGPRDVEVAAPLSVIPVFARANAVLPRDAVVAHTGLRAGAPAIDLYPVPAAPEGSLRMVFDDGESLGYLRGDQRVVPLSLSADAEGATFTVGPSEGSRPLPAGPWTVRFRHVAAMPTSVLSGTTVLPTSAWRWDADAQTATVTLDALSSLRVRYDARRFVTPQTTVRLRATVPASTPTDASLFVATSVTGWRPDGVRMTRVDATHATAVVSVEEGTFVGYKYTRGSWATVERAAGCAERPNRAVRAGDTAPEDTVDTWADRCP